MVTVSVILVNYNGEALLDDCLRALNAQTFGDFEVIFVDNGSRDGSIATARKRMPAIRIVALQKNTGFATGNNEGLRAASGKYIALLNNDTEADPNFLSELVAAIERDPKAGAVAPKILNFFDRTIIDSVGGILVTHDGIGAGRGRGETDRGQYDALTDALCPSGCAALYRRSALEETGLFSDDFFAYCEDTDLGLRLLWADWKTVVAPKAIVYHKYSASSGSYSPLKLRLVERNHYFVALRNFPMRRLLLLPLWTGCRYAIMALAILSGRGKGKAAKSASVGALLLAFLQAHWEAFVAMPAKLRERPAVRRISGGQFAARMAAHHISLRKLFFTE